jgi:uncharacterized SAM-dependent methyltransferase
MPTRDELVAELADAELLLKVNRKLAEEHDVDVQLHIARRDQARRRIKIYLAHVKRLRTALGIDDAGDALACVGLWLCVGVALFGWIGG